MKVEDMPDLQVQPVRAALVLLNPACPCWEFAGNFQEAAPGIHPHSLTGIRKFSKVRDLKYGKG